MPFKYPAITDRIIANSVLSLTDFFDGTPCWLWTGALCRAGYPKMAMRWKSGRRKGQIRTVGAHRVSLIEFKGVRLGRDCRALHLCNTRICVNPAHLISGSQLRNMRQCVKDGRHGNAYRAPVAEQERLKRLEKATYYKAFDLEAAVHDWDDSLDDAFNCSVHLWLELQSQNPAGRQL